MRQGKFQKAVDGRRHPDRCGRRFFRRFSWFFIILFLLSGGTWRALRLDGIFRYCAPDGLRINPYLIRSFGPDAGEGFCVRVSVAGFPYFSNRQV